MPNPLPIQAFRPSEATLVTVASIRDRERWHGLNAMVVGAGRSGVAAARLLQGRGAHVRFAEERRYEALTAETRAEFSPEVVGPVDAVALRRADLVVLSPGFPRDRPELAESIRRGVLVGEVELASWFITKPLVAITGTNGKSTTTALVGHLLKGAGLRVFVGGNLGRPASEMPAGDYEVGVLELSSYQLESMVFARFRVAVWLNLTPDHLDRYRDVSHYAAAKARLLDLVEPEGTIVLNREDPFLVEFGRDRPGVVWFSAEQVASTYSFPSVPGRHNRSNVAAALVAVAPFSPSTEQLREGLAGFPGLPHRLERVRQLDGVAYFNDSKATNVDSASTAVSALPEPKILIAGGKDKGASWAPLVDLSRDSVRAVLAIGEAAPLVVSAFSGAVPLIEDVGTLEAAVRRAQRLAAPGEVVLLSPACASFDQFRNFEHRGDEFRRLVSALESTRSSDD